MSIQTSKKVALIILDGWGYRKEKKYNAIAQAKTPNWDSLLSQHSFSLLSASGSSVGLPAGQMGNSEVGHMHIGSGQIIRQDLCRINQACQSDEFEKLVSKHKIELQFGQYCCFPNREDPATGVRFLNHDRFYRGALTGVESIS